MGLLYLAMAAAVLGSAIATYRHSLAEETRPLYAYSSPRAYAGGLSAGAAKAANDDEEPSKPLSARIMDVTNSILTLIFLGALIWQTCVAFEDNLWLRMKPEIAPEGGYPCERGFYRGSAITSIVLWSFLAILLGVVLLLVICFCCCACACGSDGLRGITSALGFAPADSWISSAAKKKREDGKGGGCGGRGSSGSPGRSSGSGDGISNPSAAEGGSAGHGEAYGAGEEGGRATYRGARDLEGGPKYE